MNRAHALPAVALTLALGGLAACTPADAGQGTVPGEQPSAAVSTPPNSSATPNPSPTPTPSVDPRTAAVTKTVDRYYKVTDELYRKPNKAPWRQLQTVSRGEAFNALQSELLDMFSAEQHATGATTYKIVKVGKVQKKSGHLQVSVATCWDVSAVDVVDKRGKSVIDKKKRPNRGGDALTVRQDGKGWYVVRDWNGKEKC